MGTQADNDNDLHGNFDATVWAERFVQRVKENPGIATDEGTMLAWFSAALMAGYDFCYKKWQMGLRPTERQFCYDCFHVPCTCTTAVR